MALYHNELCAASRCKRYLAGQEDQPNNYGWPRGPEKYWKLVNQAAVKGLIIEFNTSDWQHWH